MKIELIEVGKTYIGRKGKPRTVVAKLETRYNANLFDVQYHQGDPSKTSLCWCATFGNWAVCEMSDQSRRKHELLRNAALELYQSLKRAEMWVETIASLYPGHERDGGTVEDDLIDLQSAIAKAEGK